MRNIKIKKAAINADGLHAELKAALGERCAGLSFTRGVVTVHLLDGADADPIDAEVEASIAAVVVAHDPARLTPVQEAARVRDALPFFNLEREALVAQAEKMPAADFQREMARAFAYLRDLL